MQNLFFRLIETLLLLSKRLKSFTNRKRKQAGIFGLITFVGVFVAARPVFAQTSEPGVLAWFFELIGNLAIAIAGFLSQMVVAIINAIIPVMLYNDFSNNPIVSAGWAIMRDTVNMFFVIILIIVAFGTIFGHSRFQWQQQIPKLMIFAIVINFSKTLCGLMIDFGQIIMLTFANALQEIAAGNFIQLLGLGDIYSVSTATDKMQNQGGTSAFDWMAAGLGAAFIMLIVFVTMVLLLVILLYRIVMLWIMIVLAPLAWFVGGAGGANGIVRSNAYAQWWERFKCLVAIGPVLTFFLWLTLAVAGAGNVARSTGFNVGSPTGIKNPSAILSTIFELDRFISFIIGIAMIYAGFEAAQQLCSSMSGSFLGKQLSGKSPFKAPVVRGAAGAGAKVGAWGARQAYRPIGAAGRGVRRSLGAALDQKQSTGGRWKYTKPFTRKGRADIARAAVGKAPKPLQKLIAPVVQGYATGQEQKTRDDVAKAAEKYKDRDKSVKVDQLERFAEGGASTLTGGKNEAMGLMMEAMGDKEMMKQLRASGAGEKLWEENGEDLKRVYASDSASMDKIEKFEKENADITGATHLINDEQDVRDLSDQAVADGDVRAAMRSKQMRYKGQVMNMEDAAEQGAFGARKQAIVQEAMAGGSGKGALYDRMSNRELSRVSTEALLSSASVATLARAMKVATQQGNAGRADALSAGIASGSTGADSNMQMADGRDALESAQWSFEDVLADESVPDTDRARVEDVAGRNAERLEAAQQTSAPILGEHPDQYADSVVLAEEERTTQLVGYDAIQPMSAAAIGQKYVKRAGFADQSQEEVGRALHAAGNTADAVDQEAEGQKKEIAEASPDMNPILTEFQRLTEEIGGLRESIETQVESEMAPETQQLDAIQNQLASSALEGDQREKYKIQAKEIAKAINQRRSEVTDGTQIMNLMRQKAALQIPPEHKDLTARIVKTSQDRRVAQATGAALEDVGRKKRET